MIGMWGSGIDIGEYKKSKSMTGRAMKCRGPQCGLVSDAARGCYRYYYYDDQRPSIVVNVIQTLNLRVQRPPKGPSKV